MRSSAALMAIIDDILDLATVDTGEIDADARAGGHPRDHRRGAVAGVQDRLAECKLTLDSRTCRAIGTMVADGKRVRQVLFNLLSNAIGFSRERPDRHGYGRAHAAATSCSAYATKAAASRPNSSTGSSTGSRAIRRAPLIAASASACRSSGPSWSCMAATSTSSPPQAREPWSPARSPPAAQRQCVAAE